MDGTVRSVLDYEKLAYEEKLKRFPSNPFRIFEFLQKTDHKQVKFLLQYGFTRPERYLRLCKEDLATVIQEESSQFRRNTRKKLKKVTRT